jgi:hypothetical protein
LLLWVFLVFWFVLVTLLWRLGSRTKQFTGPFVSGKQGKHGGRGRLQAQYTGADATAGNSSLPNFNDRHNLITTQFIRRKHRP